ncbi:MAG TPA: hypothetical protein VI564_03885 [Candidatus Nanoarchaeia archaeon]|nr:hypothetical protein [Candidatus Nanoarchaeia archaeon]
MNGIIDEKLFRPLSGFLINQTPDLNRLEESILELGVPERRVRRSRLQRYAQLHNYRAFVLEFYIKSLLGQYSEIDESFVPFPHQFMKFENGFELFTNKWGNITFYSEEFTKIEGELDALWEFHISELITPIIFEITYGQNAHESERFSRISKKIELVSMLYEDPCLCKVRFKKGDEEPGLYERMNGIYREIIIPKQDLDSLARNLWNKAPQYEKVNY